MFSTRRLQYRCLRVRLVVLNGVLLVVVALAIVGVEAADRSASSVEASVRRYAMAVGNSDLDGAMAEIAPDQRATWNDWVQGQLGNVYVVRGIAVRAPWFLAQPSEVTAVLDVDPDWPDEFYQASPTVPVENYQGRFYLAAPLLAEQ
jgi:hypothetical protein